MHDIDSTVMEFESEAESEHEFEDYEEELELESEYDDSEGVFDEAEEMDLAAELLGVTDDEELEQFLGKLIKKAGRAVGRFARSSTGRALGRVLKGAAKKALPIVGGAIGSAFGGPAGGAVGSKLASSAGRIFGLELEGLSPEDQEFEVARRFVRMAGDAAKNAAVTPTGASPQQAAKIAVVKAAKKHAPGLLKGGMAPSRGGGRSGRWVRRGSKIVLLGV